MASRADRTVKTFFSWTGRRGLAAAVVLAAWFESEAEKRDVDFVASISSNLTKGKPWLSELRSDLESSDTVVMCLTPEAIVTPSAWMVFEAGIIGQTMDDARVFPYLLDPSGPPLSEPLSIYQATRATAADTRQLVELVIGRGAESAEAWQASWRDLHAGLRRIDRLMLDEVITDIEAWFHRKTFDEPVEDCLDQSWESRYAGAIETLAKLRIRQADVAATGDTFLVDVFTALAGEVDSYATAIKGLLLNPRQSFAVGDDGRLAIPHGVRAALNERRVAVKALVSQAVDPQASPIHDPSFRFSRAGETTERKTLIHRRERQLDKELEEGLIAWSDIERWMDSDWAFDRISGYLGAERSPADDDGGGRWSRLLAAAQRELDSARSADFASFMPFYYALRSLHHHASAVRPSDQAWFAEAQATFEKARPKAEANDPVLVVLGELQAAAQKQSEATSG